MRRVYSLILMVALLVTASVISGCFPPNYSKEQAKKIVSEHKHEALAWFSKNMPAAKPDSDCEAYATEFVFSMPKDPPLPECKCRSRGPCNPTGTIHRWSPSCAVSWDEDYQHRRR